MSYHWMRQRLHVWLFRCPGPTAGRKTFTYSGETVTGIPHGGAPNLLNTSYTITAEVEIPQGGAEGIINTNGGRFGGYALYLIRNKPVFTWNLFNLKRVRWEGKDSFSPGKHSIEFDFKDHGLGSATLALNNVSGIGRGGVGVLRVDGKVVATEKMEHTGPRSSSSGTTPSTSARTPERRWMTGTTRCPSNLRARLRSSRSLSMSRS